MKLKRTLQIIGLTTLIIIGTTKFAVAQCSYLVPGPNCGGTPSTNATTCVSITYDPTTSSYCTAVEAGQYGLTPCTPHKGVS